ncbi:MAG TPA: NAD-dependent epimerase/dehydratase family protein, partial [Oscillatoriaceae cyanobacterium]
MRVLVTGAAGYFASQIIPALLADDRIDGVVATDREPLTLQAPKLRFAQRDLERDDPADLLASCEAVIHLAFRVERRPGEDTRAINVDAHQRFLREAALASEVL